MMIERSTDVLLKRMFTARAIVLVAGAALVAAIVFRTFAEEYLFAFQEPNIAIWEQITVSASAAIYLLAMIAIFAGSPVVWYYICRVGLHEGGPKYAIGHLLLCMALTPVLLTGILFIPILVYWDIERWGESAHCLATDRAETP
jgi:hypothetical protein